MTMKMRLTVKNRSHRYDTLEAQFMKKLSNTEAGLNKSVAYKKIACKPILCNYPPQLIHFRLSLYCSY